MESGALLVSTEPVAEEPTVLQLLTSKSPEKFSPASKVKVKNINSGTFTKQENKLLVLSSYSWNFLIFKFKNYSVNLAKLFKEKCWKFFELFIRYYSLLNMKVFNLHNF